MSSVPLIHHPISGWIKSSPAHIYFSWNILFCCEMCHIRAVKLCVSGRSSRRENDRRERDRRLPLRLLALLPLLAPPLHLLLPPDLHPLQDHRLPQHHHLLQEEARRPLRPHPQEEEEEEEVEEEEEEEEVVMEVWPQRSLELNYAKWPRSVTW